MVDLRPDDLKAVQLVLLSHIDPLMAVEVSDRALRHPDQVAQRNTVVFATGIDARLHSLLRRLVSGALDQHFLGRLLHLIAESRIANVNAAGLNVLGRLDPEWEVLRPPPPHDEQGAAAMRAPDGICDLMMQPLMAFSNCFSSLAGDWPKFASDPELAGKVYYRTNRATYFEARLENLIRRELGLSTELFAGITLNVP